MLNADRVPYFATCPRCSCGSFERLRTHAFCVNCNYVETSSDEIGALPNWVSAALAAPNKRMRSRCAMRKGKKLRSA